MLCGGVKSDAGNTSDRRKKNMLQYSEEYRMLSMVLTATIHSAGGQDVIAPHPSPSEATSRAPEVASTQPHRS